ncbi:hypothetical protein PIROE2DRAFT_16013, partial [Piromyces sp. E2]
PVTLSYTVLYSNKDLLKKYNKEPPKTWDELINTSKFILNEEKKLNSEKELRAYNGLFNELWAEYSFYDFIYSCRDSIDSPFPDIRSNATRRAYETLKKLKEEISSDEEFQLMDDYTIGHLISGNSIFLKYWILAEPDNSVVREKYQVSVLPGYFEGVSSSRISGFNIGIDVNVKDDKDKIKAIIEFVTFSTSWEIQKELFIKGDSVPAIFSLFDDEEVCSIRGDCEMFKNIQHMKKPDKERKLVPDFDEKFYYHSEKYLFEDVSLEDTIDHLDDISRIYYIPLNSNESSIGLINMWFIVIIGLVMTLCSSIMNIGQITVLKCQLKVLLINSEANDDFVENNNINSNDSAEYIAETSFSESRQIGDISNFKN